MKTFTLVPKLKRLEENEIKKFEKSDNNEPPGNAPSLAENAMNNLPLKIRIVAQDKLEVVQQSIESQAKEKSPENSEEESKGVEERSSSIEEKPIVDTSVSRDNNDEKPGTSGTIEEKRSLRRKKSAVGSMEDLWDETIFEEFPKKVKVTNEAGTFHNEKAAKKALRKAKKEAKRKKKEEEKKKIHAETGIGFSLDDVVWANLDELNDKNWWPAKILSFGPDYFEVKLFGPSAEIVSAKRIKPFMELIHVIIAF